MATPEQYAQFRKGFNGGTDPFALATHAVQGYQQALPAGQPGAQPAPEEMDSAKQMHMYNAQQKAKEAHDKYLEDNNLDENLEPKAPQGPQ